MAAIFTHIGPQALNRRLQRHLRAGSSDLAPGKLQLPADYYLDPEQWQREREYLFQRLPLLAGFSVELPAPGDYKALQLMDTSVLLIRGDDQRVRAFINSCQHRGGRLKDEGRGHCHKLVCPYHAWRYNRSGELISILDQEKFGELERRQHNLAPLACAEDAGLIFVSLGETVVLEEFLGGMLAELRELGLERWQLWDRRELSTGNWKLAHDGYLDGYHLASLHPHSVGSVVHNNVLLFDHWGPHQRMSFAQKELDRDRAPELPDAGTIIIRTVFPNVSISVARDWGGMISVLWPGASADQSRTEQYFLYAPATENEEYSEQVRAEIALYHNAVRAEDYSMVDKVQQNLAVGSPASVTFGRNELGNQRWHAWLKYYCEQSGEAPSIPTITAQ